MACIRKRRGKWVVDYRDGAGIRRWRSFDTRRAAEDGLAKLLPQTRQWTQTPTDGHITVEAYGVRWLSLIRATVKPRTYASYGQTLTHHIVPVLGSVQLHRLHRGMIKAFLAQKLEAGRVQKTECQATGLSRNSVRIIHATLRALLKAAVDDGIITINPAEKLGVAAWNVEAEWPGADQSDDPRAAVSISRSRSSRDASLLPALPHPGRHWPQAWRSAGFTMARPGPEITRDPCGPHYFRRPN
jgi:hypothetical protein